MTKDSSQLPGDLEHTIRRNYTNDKRSNGGSISMEEAIAIASVIYRYRPQFTLEIGFASGSSAAVIIATKKYLNIVKPHVCVRPLPSYAFKRSWSTIYTRAWFFRRYRYRRRTI